MASMFGSKKPVQGAPPEEGRSARALKVIEERISNLDKKTELIENNILSLGRRQNAEIKTLHSKVLTVEKDIALIKRTMTEIASDLRNFARIEEVETIRKYLDAWEPLNFITRGEAEDIIKELIESTLGKRKV